MGKALTLSVLQTPLPCSAPALRVALSSCQWKDWYSCSHEGGEAEGGRERVMPTSSRGCWLGPVTLTRRHQRGWRWDKREDSTSGAQGGYRGGIPEGW